MSHVLLVQGDACHIPLPSQSVNTICTSPPYYGLRRYNGLEPTVWTGGSYVPQPGLPPVVIPGPTPEVMAACAHAWKIQNQKIDNNNGNGSTTAKVAFNTASRYKEVTTANCLTCGAWRGSLGEEPAPHFYVFHTMLWLREVWRVLRNDGMALINLGDSYSSSGKSGGGAQGRRWETYGQDHLGPHGGKWHTTPGYPQGSLIGIPQQVQLAAMGEGWTVRSVPVWAKEACMPESVAGSRWECKRCPCVHSVATYTQGFVGQSLGDGNRDSFNSISNTPYSAADPACPQCHGTGRLDTLVLRQGSWRFTSSYEPILMLTKGMQYWANGDAVREPLQEQYAQRRLTVIANKKGIDRSWHGAPVHGLAPEPVVKGNPSGRNPRNVLRVPATPTDQLHALTAWLAQEAPEILAAYEDAQPNAGDVLRLKASSLNLEHYASFPPSLPELFIKAACPEKCCPHCGAGWAPIVSHTKHPDHRERGQSFITTLTGERGGYKTRSRPNGVAGYTEKYVIDSHVHGVLPTCAHYCTCTPHTTRLLVIDLEQPDVATLPAVEKPEPFLYMVGPESCPHCGLLRLASWTPGKVLDCFAGAATTLLVARALGRESIGIEMSKTYLALARKRLGLEARDIWEGKQQTILAKEDFTDLPLFHGVS